MKRQITLAVDQEQYGLLHHAIIERIYHNNNEMDTTWAYYKGSVYVATIKEENDQLTNLLEQLESEFKHVFK